MNLFIFKGRLTKDVEKRMTTTGTTVASFTVAVDRKFKQEGQDTTDFFNITAFGKTGDFVEQYFKKGQEILINGRVQNRSYEDDNGVRRYVTDYIAESVEFCGKKEDTEKTTAPDSDGEFITVDDSDDLPF